MKDAMINELFAFGAFAAGAVLFSRSKKEVSYL